MTDRYNFLSVNADDRCRMTWGEIKASHGQPQIDVFLDGVYCEFVTCLDVERGYVDVIARNESKQEHRLLGYGNMRRKRVDRLFGKVTLKIKT